MGLGTVFVWPPWFWLSIRCRVYIIWWSGVIEFLIAQGKICDLVYCQIYVLRICEIKDGFLICCTSIYATRCIVFCWLPCISPHTMSALCSSIIERALTGQMLENPIRGTFAAFVLGLLGSLSCPYLSPARFKTNKEIFYRVIRILGSLDVNGHVSSSITFWSLERLEKDNRSDL